MFRLAITACLGAGAWAAEVDALRISGEIAERHIPFATIVDPIYDGEALVGYTRCGDSAIWTGHWLAAESFRYAVTRTPEALAAVRRAIDGAWILVEVTGRNSLARCAIPSDSPWRDRLLAEEAHHGSYSGSINGRPYVWIGNTSRDQYAGMFFGLGTAWDLVDDPAIRTTVRDLVSRLLWRLRDDSWAVVMPDGHLSTVFWGRADLQLSFLQVGRRINPGQFDRDYQDLRFWAASSMIAPMTFEAVDDHHSYFKYNLAYISFFNLIRLEDSSFARCDSRGASP